MRAWTVIPAAVLAAAGASARADAPAPSGYGIEADGGTVTVLLYGAERTCPDQGLLRRNTATNEIVKLTTCQDASRFVDECVPAGTYQYGLAVPYACSVSGSEYYAEVTVDGPAGECTRAVADPAPASSVPWGSTRMVCEDHYRGPGDGCGTGGAVLGTNLVALLAGLALWRRRPRRRA